MYTLAQAAEVADMKVATLRAWFSADSKIGVFRIGDTDRPAAFAGDTRLLSASTLLAVAIAAALTRLGVSLPCAADAGMKFAHTQGGNPRRPLPGSLYPPLKLGRRRSVVQRTIILVAGNRIEIFPITPGSKAIEILAMVGTGAGATLLVVDPIVERVGRFAENAAT